jgi:hypothetical protein
MPLLEPKHLKHTSQVNSAILPGDLLGEVLYDYHGSRAFPLWGRNIANLGWLMVAHEVNDEENGQGGGRHNILK